MAKWYETENSMGIMKRKYLHEEEDPSNFIPRIASIFSDGLKGDVYNVLDNADFLPAGRTLFGAGYKGKRKVSLSNCYTLPSPEDNIESIFDTAKMIARISSYGGGCGLAIDNLRPKGSNVNNSAMESTGAVSFLNIFDATGCTIGQNGRRAALMVGFRCDHPDIYEFLRVKQNNEKLASMNISIKFTNEFMKAVEDHSDFELEFDSPQTGRITKTINAYEFFKEFCETNYDWGDPGCIFIDKVRSHHLLAGYPEYKIDICNPCGEMFGIGGNSCNLGSINLYNMIKNKFEGDACIDYDKLKYTTHVAVKMLDEILDYGYDMQPLEINKKVITDWRYIGLGVFGLADAFVAMGIRYGSKESRQAVKDIMSTIIRQAIITSSEIAKEKGSFGKYEFEKTINNPFFNGEFADLIPMIRENGIRNGNLMCIAPTGTLSIFAGNFTGGVEPMFKLAYTRSSHNMEEHGKTFTIYSRGVEELLNHHGIDKDNITIDEVKKKFPFLIESHDVPYMERIMIQAEMQQYVDNAISSTVNLTNTATAEDIYKIYTTAWAYGLKGITIFRDGCKRGNILGVADPKENASDGKIPAMDSVDPPSRRKVKKIDGSTVRECTSCVKSLYVTVNNTPEGKPFEVFTNASGGCKTNINTISRLISLGLRSGIKVSRILDELRANQCPACQLLRKQGRMEVALSCSNAIADAIQATLDPEKINKSNVEEENQTIKRVCPECGMKTLMPEGKCVTCSNCGWNKSE